MTCLFLISFKFICTKNFFNPLYKFLLVHFLHVCTFFSENPFYVSVVLLYCKWAYVVRSFLFYLYCIMDILYFLYKRYFWTFNRFVGLEVGVSFFFFIFSFSIYDGTRMCSILVRIICLLTFWWSANWDNAIPSYEGTWRWKYYMTFV